MSDVLVLNADAQPVSYLPLSAIQWKEAITYMCLDKVTVLDWYDDWVKIKKPKLVLADEYCGETRVVYKIGPGD